MLDEDEKRALRQKQKLRHGTWSFVFQREDGRPNAIPLIGIAFLIGLLVAGIAVLVVRMMATQG